MAAAAKRKVMEECGLSFEPLMLIGFYQWDIKSRNIDYVRICLHGAIDGKSTPGPADPDIIGVEWMPVDETGAAIERLRSPVVKLCIDNYLSGVRYPLTLINRL